MTRPSAVSVVLGLALLAGESSAVRAESPAGLLDADIAAPCSDVQGLAGSPEAAGEASPGVGTIALEDVNSVLVAPLHWSGKDWLVFGGVAAGVAAAGFAFDVPMRNKTQAHQTSTLDELTKVVEPFGAGYSWAVIGAYGIAGFAFRDGVLRLDRVVGAVSGGGSLLGSALWRFAAPDREGRRPEWCTSLRCGGAAHRTGRVVRRQAVAPAREVQDPVDHCGR